MTILGRAIAVFLSGALVASVLSFFLARTALLSAENRAGAVLAKRDAEIAQLREGAASSRAAGYKEALSILADQQEALNQKTDQALRQIADIPTSLQGERSKLRATLQEYTRDAKYDCRRLPLPDPVLERLRRQGDQAPPAGADDRASTQVPTPPASVPPDTSVGTSDGRDQ